MNTSILRERSRPVATKGTVRAAAARSLAQNSIVIFSTDSTLVSIVCGAENHGWRALRGSLSCGEFHALAAPNLRVIVFDDDHIELADRGWMLAQIHKRAPGAALIYVAGHHDRTTERRARAGGALYYCAKPLDRAQFAIVLAAFFNATK